MTEQTPLPELPSLAEIRERLASIFQEGTPHRNYFVREMAARVVFVMLYVGAVEKLGRWLGPKHVYCMSDAQSERRSEAERVAYGDTAWKAGFEPQGKRWYADTTREPIRDETLRDGLVSVGAVIQKPDVATTSSKPRYALRDDFAALFDPSLKGQRLTKAVQDWQETYLDPFALARIELLRQGVATVDSRVEIVFPNRTLRQIAPGPSSLITKAVIEVFAPNFLYQPAVLLLSESGDKIVAQEERIIRGIGLNVDRAKLLPDVILFDLAKDRELLVFVEVVATDGPVTEGRKRALLELAEGARMRADRIAFLTAYRDRSSPAFRKTVERLAWNTLAWFMAEPDYVMVLREKPSLQKDRIFDLIR